MKKAVPKAENRTGRVKMLTMLQIRSREEVHSVIQFLAAKYLNHLKLHMKYLQCTVMSACCLALGYEAQGNHSKLTRHEPFWATLYVMCCNDGREVRMTVLF